MTTTSHLSGERDVRELWFAGGIVIGETGPAPIVDTVDAIKQKSLIFPPVPAITVKTAIRVSMTTENKSFDLKFDDKVEAVENNIGIF
jgi:hypothetical protein